MATLSSIASDVYVLTNRPDLAQETKVAIRKAIFKFHGADTFKRDVAIQRIDFSSNTPIATNQFRWAIPLTDFPRFRRPRALIAPPDLVSPYPFEERTQADIFDHYGYEKPNYFFISGSLLTINSYHNLSYLDLSYYQWPAVPAVVTDPIVSWICDQYVDAIIEEAAGTVFKMIGKDDEYNRYQALFSENIAIVRGTDLGENN